MQPTLPPYFDPNNLDPAQLQQLYSQLTGMLPPVSPPQGLLTNPTPVAPAPASGLLAATPTPTPSTTSDNIHQGLLGRIASRVEDRLLPVDPALSSADTSAARHQALLNASLAMMQASSRPGASLLGAVSQALPAARAGYAEDVNQRHLQELTAHVHQLVPLTPDMTPEQQYTAVGQMALLHLQAGDETGAKAYSELATAMKQRATMEQPNLSPLDAQAYAAAFPDLPPNATPEAQRANVAAQVKWLMLHGYSSQAGRMAQTLPAYATALNPVAVAQRNTSLGQGAERLGSTMRQAFEKSPDIAGYIKLQEPYMLAQSALGQVALGNPAAYKTAIMAYARALDPKAQMRSQMLDYISQMDPTLVGSLEARIDKLSAAKFTPQVAAGMQALLEDAHNNAAAAYERGRAAETNRHPDANLRPTSEIFGPSGSTPTMPNATPAPASGYSPNNPFAPKP